MELKTQLDSLTEVLNKIQETQQRPINLDGYVKKLINVKHKVTVVYNVLQGAQVCSFFSSFCIEYSW